MVWYLWLAYLDTKDALSGSCPILYREVSVQVKLMISLTSFLKRLSYSIQLEPGCNFSFNQNLFCIRVLSWFKCVLCFITALLYILCFRFGPPRATWCLRMEGKHSFFKGCTLRNFKNLPLSLSKKHQTMFCHEWTDAYKHNILTHKDNFSQRKGML